MPDLREETSVRSSETARQVDILSGGFGFHYTTDQGLPGILQHGLLSRMEERKRGVKTRLHESKSIPNAIYFTTRINDLYFSTFEREGISLDEALEDVIGIAIDKPDYATVREGWFAEDDFVEPERFGALVVVDRKAYEKPRARQRDTHDKYEFGGPLPDEQIRVRVEGLRKMCQEAGRNIPIVGVSGKVY